MSSQHLPFLGSERAAIAPSRESSAIATRASRAQVAARYTDVTRLGLSQRTRWIACSPRVAHDEAFFEG